MLTLLGEERSPPTPLLLLTFPKEVIGGWMFGRLKLLLAIHKTQTTLTASTTKEELKSNGAPKKKKQS